VRCSRNLLPATCQIGATIGKSRRAAALRCLESTPISLFLNDLMPSSSAIPPHSCR
jgi:hypothetical protein